jgi:hypothetical protein
MTKPHEETWRYIGEATGADRLGSRAWVVDEADPFRCVYSEFGGVTGETREDTHARAKLAAQAPAMARLLLRLVDPSTGHGDLAEVVAILRAAGVLP